MFSQKKIKTLAATIIKKCHTPKWLFIVLLIVLILRIPSFIEPYSYGDEMIYLSLGEAIKQGIPLYKGIHDNKPPLLYITAGIAGNLFWFRAILAIWNIVTIFLFWKLAEALFPKKKKLQQIATTIFALLTTLPLLEGNIANAELFMIGPIIAAFLILLTKKLTPKNLVSAGVLFSIATLYKVPAVFDFPAIIFYWLVTNKINKKNILIIAKNTGYMILGFVIPIAISFVWYYFRGAFSEYLIAAFLQNFGYLSTWRPGDVQESFLVRNGPLFARAVVVAIGLVILYWKRNKLSKQYIFLTAWLLLSLFAVSLSERPYPHYLIQALPQISILSAMLLTLKVVEQVLVIIPLSLAFLVPVYFRFWHYPVTSYYLRFYKFATHQITKQQYFSMFDGNVSRNYEIANYIISSTRKKDKVFVWGNGSVIYALSRRFPPGKFVADYHIRDFSTPQDTLSGLKRALPKLIIILPDSEPFPGLNSLLRKNFVLLETIDGAHIWSVLSPTVRALVSP